MDVFYHEETKKHEDRERIGVSCGGGFLFVLLPAGGDL
jgi:hypothetical protein